MTRWPLGGATQTKATVAALSVSSAGAILAPVWAATYEDLVAGNGEPFGSAIPLGSSGFLQSEWTAIPAGALSAGEVCVMFEIEVSSPVSVLELGIAEIRIR